MNTENKVEGAMGAVDCATETNLCKEQEVKGYPTCKYFFTSCPGKPCLAVFSSGVRAHHFRGTRHFRIEKETGAKMRPAIVSGIVTADAPRSLCKS